MKVDDDEKEVTSKNNSSRLLRRLRNFIKIQWMIRPGMGEVYSGRCLVCRYQSMTNGYLPFREGGEVSKDPHFGCACVFRGRCWLAAVATEVMTDESDGVRQNPTDDTPGVQRCTAVSSSLVVEDPQHPCVMQTLSASSSSLNDHFFPASTPNKMRDSV